MDGNREVLFCDKNNMRRKNLIDPNHNDKQHTTHPEACQSHQGYSSAGLQNGQEVGDRTKKNILGGKICIEPLFLKKKDFYWTVQQPAMKQNMKQSFIMFLQTQRMVRHWTQLNEPIMLAICYQ